MTDKGGTFSGALTLDEVLEQLKTAEAIIAEVVVDGCVVEHTISYEKAEALLRGLARQYEDDARGFNPPRWEGRVAHLGLILGGFAT